jgi:hypothetical protein
MTSPKLQQQEVSFLSQDIKKEETFAFPLYFMRLDLFLLF